VVEPTHLFLLFMDLKVDLQGLNHHLTHHQDILLFKNLTI